MKFEERPKDFYRSITDAKMEDGETILWYPREEQIPSPMWAAWRVTSKTDDWSVDVLETPCLRLRGSYVFEIVEGLPPLHHGLRVSGREYISLNAGYMPEFLYESGHQFTLERLWTISREEAHRISRVYEDGLRGMRMFDGKTDVITMGTTGWTERNPLSATSGLNAVYLAHRSSMYSDAYPYPFPEDSWEMFLIREGSVRMPRHPPYTSPCMFASMFPNEEPYEGCFALCRARDWMPPTPADYLDEAGIWISGRMYQQDSTGKGLTSWKREGNPVSEGPALSPDKVMGMLKENRVLDLVRDGSQGKAIWIAGVYDTKKDRLLRWTVHQGEDLGQVVTSAVTASLK